MTYAFLAKMLPVVATLLPEMLPLFQLHIFMDIIKQIKS